MTTKKQLSGFSMKLETIVNLYHETIFRLTESKHSKHCKSVREIEDHYNEVNTQNHCLTKLLLEE